MRQHGLQLPNLRNVPPQSANDEPDDAGVPATRISPQLLAAAILAILATVCLVYYPSLQLQILGENWNYIEWSAKLNLAQYLTRALDPRVQVIEYRPLGCLIFYGEYLAFGFNPVGYHAVRLLVHAANALVLFFIVLHVSKTLRVAAVAAIVFGSLPVYFQTVFTPADWQPETALFYLLGQWAWIRYLENRNGKHYVATLIAFTLALLGKESNVIFLVTLVLVNLLLIRQRFDLIQFVLRYVPFGIILLLYLAIEAVVQTNGLFVRTLGYGFGMHALENLGRYFALWAWPWGVDTRWIYAWSAAVSFAFIAIALWKRSARVLFIPLCAGTLILPYIWLHAWLFNARYLYLPATLTAIAVALLFEQLHTWMKRPRVMAFLLAVVVGYIVVAGGGQVATAASDWQETVRRRRVPARDIILRHPTFEEDTLLYFVNPPEFRDLSGLLFARYGERVLAGSSVDVIFVNDILYPIFQRVGVPVPATGVGARQVAGLRDHQTSFVYYFDSTGKPIEVPVGPDSGTFSAPALPATFSAPIRLEGYELTGNMLMEGHPLVLLLYWRATQAIDRDYTVFARLADARGNVLEASDSQPLGGAFPTHEWRPGEQVVDGIPLTVPAGASRHPGVRLEVGLYHLPTMEQLQVIDNAGVPLADKVVIEPLFIERGVD